MKPLWQRVVLALPRWAALLAIAAGAPTVQADQPHTEAAVEAAYLLRFGSYIEWPTPPAPGRTFVIDVVGDADVARALRQLIPAHAQDERHIEVREIASTRDVGDAQIVYLGPGSASFLRLLDAKVAAGVLLVSHEDDGLDLGAMLNFVTIDNRVRFEISLATATRAHFKVSADLLSVALRVHGGGRQTDTLCNVPAVLRRIDACGIREAQHQWQYPEARDEGGILPPSAVFWAVETTG